METINIIDKDSLEYFKEKKQALIKIIMISSGIDFAMGIPEAAAFLPSFGGSMVAEEIVEYFISNFIGNLEEYDIKVSWLDKAKGFIPIPGFTSLTLKCWKELKKVNAEIDRRSQK